MSTITASHQQAIRTVYLGPTNSRGSRIKATCAAGSVTVGYEDDAVCAHAVAAQALLDKLGWEGTMVSGGLPGGSMCFVFTSRTGD